MAITPNTNKLDFHDIKSELKEYLKSQDKLKDYNFEGSVINSVLDVLAYTTHYNAFNANMAVNESFLDTSQLRSSAVSHAKLLGYTPRSYTSSTVRADISGTDNKFVLERGSTFSSISNDNIPVTFVVKTPVEKVNSVYQDVTLVEGKLVEDEYRYNVEDNEPFYLSNKNCNISTLVVTVSKPTATNIDGGQSKLYIPIKSISDVLTISNLYWTQENKNGLYSVYFGDGIIGDKLENGDIVSLSYIAGSDINPSIYDNISNIYDESGVYSINLLGQQTTGGDTKESIESIKFNSPLGYVAQNRAVTTDDYIALIKKEKSGIKSIKVWGGETEIPPSPGNVFISIVPETGDVLSLSDKHDIQTYISKKNIIGINTIIKDPVYINMHLDIEYDSVPYAAQSHGQIRELIKAAVLEYNNNILKSFEGIFRKSSLLSIIDKVSPSILSSSITSKIAKDINIVDHISKQSATVLEKYYEGGDNAEWNHIENNRKQSWAFDIEFTDQILANPNITNIIVSSIFNYNNIECIFLDKYNTIENQRDINIVQASNNDVIIERNVGVVDSVGGIVHINSLILSLTELIDEFRDKLIEFKVIPRNVDVHPKFNNILSIKAEDISIHPIVK
jgi:hypothetical protein